MGEEGEVKGEEGEYGDEEESDEDRNARIRTGGLGVIRWFLGGPHFVSHTVRTPTKFLCRYRV